MRALHLVLLILLCLPLQAGEPPELAKAVEMFRSHDPTVRNEGSKLADRELRRLLAPLMKAMQDPDPEVRRRARESILQLVPYHEREPETAQERANRLRQAQVAAIQKVRFRLGRLQVQPGLQIQPAQQKALEALARARLMEKQAANAQGVKVLGKLGVTGNFQQVGQARGFRVASVRQDSSAQRSGLRVGDLIVSVNGTAFTDYDAFLKALDARRGWSGALLKLLRGVAVTEIRLR
jgi:C-terminal processing protease CtpA/Prc